LAVSSGVRNSMCDPKKPESLKQQACRRYRCGCGGRVVCCIQPCTGHGLDTLPCSMSVPCPTRSNAPSCPCC
jgi:hypothetical protein